MKKLSLTPILLLLTFALLAQAPQGISHQAVIRDAGNQLVTDSPIGLQVSIIHGTPEGTVVYSETHLPTSNTNGLISFIIGQGTVVSGIFSEIDWANGSYFIETKADPVGGTNYTIEGVSQVLSVPYSLNSANLILTSASGYKYNFSVDTYGNLIPVLNSFPDCPNSVNDFDGNTYDVVAIGIQCWMKQNLKTTHYRNGTPIENPIGNSDWENTTTGAYVWYNNDISWKDSYGALYNWYAVNNANSLCPTGWHVPSDAEFTLLTDYLGGLNVAGGKMKSTFTVPDPHPRWESPNTGATNQSNWSGLPGGLRQDTGGFGSIGYYGYFWSSTEENPTSAWFRILFRDNGYVSRYDNYKSRGSSVRCLRD